MVRTALLHMRRKIRHNFVRRRSAGADRLRLRRRDSDIRQQPVQTVPEPVFGDVGDICSISDQASHSGALGGGGNAPGSTTATVHSCSPWRNGTILKVGARCESCDLTNTPGRVSWPRKRTCTSTLGLIPGRTSGMTCICVRRCIKTGRRISRHFRSSRYRYMGLFMPTGRQAGSVSVPGATETDRQKEGNTD